MNPFAQLAVDDDDDDFVQPVAANKQPKKSTLWIIQHIRSVNSPNNKKYRRLKELLKDQLNLLMKLSQKKLNKTLKLETIGLDPKKN